MPPSNNPGNILAGQGYAGQTGDTYTGKTSGLTYTKFDSPEMGLRAVFQEVKGKLKEFNGNVWGWRTGGDSVVEAWVGANETCEKFKDSDDECVVVFRGNEFVDERIKKMFIDVDNGN